MLKDLLERGAVFFGLEVGLAALGNAVQSLEVANCLLDLV
jgi:hypothetical protein